MDGSPRRLPVRGWSVPAVMAAYLAAYFALLPPLRSQSLLFPRAVAGALIVTGTLIVVLETIRAMRDTAPAAEALRWRDPLILAALCIGYVPALWIGAFLPASALFLLLAMPLLGISWRLAVAVTLGTLAVTWLVFVRLFGVPL